MQTRGVFISTYGCQMNVNDTERMYSLLEMSNYHPVVSPDQADLIIINSCSVREKPVHKVHSEVGRYRKLKNANPRLRIGVAGCVGQQEKGQLLKDLPVLDFVFGPDNIDALPQMVEDIEIKSRFSSAKFEHGKPYQIETLVRNPGVATFVNITKGCDNFCSFCVVPFTRGRLRSRAMAEILADVHKLTERGVREITLLGQNVNSYQSDCGADFAKLLETIALDTDLLRIRYTTSHPKDFDRNLVEVMQRNRTKICDYIHLPFQSGSSRILERMNRGYTREGYLEKIRMIKEVIPGVSLSTDIIVGFPGETDSEYEETFSLVEEVGFDSIYAFMYSPRPFTKAAQYTEQVPEDVKSKRLNHLLDSHKTVIFEKAKEYVGEVYEVLVEEQDKKNGEILIGRTTQNRVMHFKGDSKLIGTLVQVKTTQAYPQNLKGDMVAPS